MSDRVDQDTRLRVILELAEERTTDRERFERVKTSARADALWFANTLQDTCGHLWITPALEADIDRAAMNHVEARMAALRAEGCGDIEVGIYPAAFALAMGDYQAEMQGEMRKAAAFGTH